MSDTMIARRYAGSLYEEALSTSVLESVDEDVAMIRESLDGAPELVRFFGSPVISREKKSVAVTSLFSDRVQPLTLKFLVLMINKGREQLFPDVVRSYQALRDDQMGIVRVSARSARSMSDEEKKSLLVTIESRLGKKVRLDMSLDASLLGGIVVRIGDTVYDGSFSNQLQSLRERLRQGVYAAG
jgi:F-type H+-transporting ATPase subunit delta